MDRLGWWLMILYYFKPGLPPNSIVHQTKTWWSLQFSYSRSRRPNPLNKMGLEVRRNANWYGKLRGSWGGSWGGRGRLSKSVAPWMSLPKCMVTCFFGWYLREWIPKMTRSVILEVNPFLYIEMSWHDIEGHATTWKDMTWNELKFIQG